MDKLWREFLTALMMTAVVPGVLLGGAVPAAKDTSCIQQEQQTEQIPRSFSVLVRDKTGKAEQWDVEDYLVGVVLAEMPVSFESEALKAQAVAARTYARKAWETGGKHGDGSVCQRGSCCQSYLSAREYVDQGGSLEGVAKVRQAVDATRGQVLTYEGGLIEATYFSCSGGSTEDALAVWGTDFPYLRAVESPGEEKAAHYSDTVVFTPEQFAATLGVMLEGKPEQWFQNVRFTGGGGVNTMEIGGKVYTGVWLRKALGLPSTAFSIGTENGKITVTTRGYGHRVGMSQYGADAMAVTGKSYREILAYYYPGTELEDLSTYVGSVNEQAGTQTA